MGEPSMRERVARALFVQRYPSSEDTWDRREPGSGGAFLTMADAVLPLIEEAVTAAVTTERERCARRAEEGYRLGENCDDIARDIRNPESHVSETPRESA